MSLPELKQGAANVDVTCVVSTTPFAGSAVTSAVLRVRHFDGVVRDLAVTIHAVAASSVTLRHVTTSASFAVAGESQAAAWLTIGGIERETIERPFLRVTRRTIPRS